MHVAVRIKLPDCRFEIARQVVVDRTHNVWAIKGNATNTAVYMCFHGAHDGPLCSVSLCRSMAEDTSALQATSKQSLGVDNKECGSRADHPSFVADNIVWCMK